MIRKILVGAALIVAIAAAPAAAQYPGFVITPGTAYPGDMVSYNGSGCEPFEEVEIGLIEAGSEGADRALPAGAVLVDTVTADEDGNFNGSFDVPLDLAPGDYTVIASCGIVQSASLTILGGPEPTNPPGGTQPAPTGPSGPLPPTGSNMDALGLLGLALLTAGGLAILITRSRHTRTI